MQESVNRLLHILLGVVLAAALSGCGGSSGGAGVTYRISGSVTGLNAASSVVLSFNGQPLTLAQNGGFVINAGLLTGETYSIAVQTQPVGEACAVGNGSGTIGTSNVTNVTVACTANPQATYTIGGAITGLNGTLQLLNSRSDALTVTRDGTFAFAQPEFDQAAYSVSIGAQPSGQTCSVSNGAGTVQGANVTSVQVTCVTQAPAPTSTYTLGGSVTGLAGGTLVLAQGAQSVTLSANGPYNFPNPLAAGAAYTVAVQTQPAGQMCSVANAAGTVGAGSVTNVDVTCAANTYSIGGTLSGLSTGVGSAVVLQDNGGDNLTLTCNGPFVFPTQLPGGATYDTAVLTQPSGQICSVANGSGTVGAADVNSVQVTCRAVQTVSFTTPGPATWTVPPGVTSIQVVATGGAGGGDDYIYGTGYGGNGAVVTATLAVTPGQVLQLFIGGGGSPGGGTGLAAGTGHYGGGSGGGATTVDAGARAQIIAGGGGGGYADATFANSAGGSGCANGFGGGNGFPETNLGFATGIGGSNGSGGAGGNMPGGLPGGGSPGGSGDGGAGGIGGPQLFPGGGGLGTGTGFGGQGGSDPAPTSIPIFGAGGGGGYGGGGGGNALGGGAGAGGSTGPAGSTCTPGTNGGSLGLGGYGSVVISY